VDEDAGDDKAFVNAAKKYNILIVPGTSFGAAPDTSAIAYCVSKDISSCAMPAFKKLAGTINLNPPAAQ
jgi:aspartate aminotransferase